jgi:hypothetical protein
MTDGSLGAQLSAIDNMRFSTAFNTIVLFFAGLVVSLPIPQEPASIGAVSADDPADAVSVDFYMCTSAVCSLDYKKD